MTTLGNNAAEQIRSYVERVERLEEEKQTFVKDIREVYKEAKSNGFDPKVLRAVVRLRAQDKAKREEFESLLDAYMTAIGF